MASVNKRGRKSKSVNFVKKNETIEELRNSSVDLVHPKILHIPMTLDELTCQKNSLVKDFYNQVGFFKPVAFNDFSPKNSFEVNNVKEIKKKIYNEIDNNNNKVEIIVYEDTILPVSDEPDTAKQILTSKTNVACWYCCHQFDTYPICAPVNFNYTKNVFKVVGCFCSFNCSKAYISSEFKGKYIHLNSFLLKRLKKQYEKITQSPPKTVLKMFGGPLTIEEYRKTFTTIDSVNINVFPMIFVPTQIEHRKVTELVRENMDNIKREKAKTSNITRKSVEKAQERLGSNSGPSKPENPNSLVNLMKLKIS